MTFLGWFYDDISGLVLDDISGLVLQGYFWAGSRMAFMGWY
jgi:hypothetical protein